MIVQKSSIFVLAGGNDSGDLFDNSSRLRTDFAKPTIGYQNPMKNVTNLLLDEFA